MMIKNDREPQLNCEFPAEEINIAKNKYNSCLLIAVANITTLDWVKKSETPKNI